MRLIFIFSLLVFFALYACEDEQSAPEPAQKTVQMTKQDLPETRVQLVGEAASETATWEPYQKFMVAFQDFDHRTDSAGLLNELIDKMLASIPENIDEPTLRARLTALRTHVAAYESFLDYNYQNPELGRKRYNEIVNALDNFHLQIMEILERNLMQEQIEEKLRQLDNDSLPLIPAQLPLTRNLDSLKVDTTNQ